MTDFMDIRLAYEKRKEARAAHWYDLQQKANSLCISLGGHLGLYGESYSLGEGHEEQRFQIGIFDDECFKRASPVDFHRKDLKVAFAIRLFVGDAQDNIAECEFIFKLNLGKSANGYVAELLSSAGVLQFPISRQFIESERKALFEAILQEVFESWDSKMMGGTATFDGGSFSLNMPASKELLEHQTILLQGESEQLPHDPSVRKTTHNLVAVNQDLSEQIVQLNSKIGRLIRDLSKAHVECAELTSLHSGGYSLTWGGKTSEPFHG
ncbi:hypothetical protein H8F21_28520 [Pseudomonas sp. P66]|uniref:Uncharacterized protein n=1 Tax=Pseudomonas arcuscaelestis TaxID=2710591 RepID=A0ABS2C6K3_9PSED|nr:hypothetical protein [Pseudomonas arcuscaelestis]MBM5461507.1 hypothetical protein [Pseudomonas arcuscaelestis]